MAAAGGWRADAACRGLSASPDAAFLGRFGPLGALCRDSAIYAGAAPYPYKGRRLRGRRVTGAARPPPAGRAARASTPRDGGGQKRQRDAERRFYLPDSHTWRDAMPMPGLLSGSSRYLSCSGRVPGLGTDKRETAFLARDR